jgi:hypothetical protein
MWATPAIIWKTASNNVSLRSTFSIDFNLVYAPIDLMPNCNILISVSHHAESVAMCSSFGIL